MDILFSKQAIANTQASTGLGLEYIEKAYDLFGEIAKNKIINPVNNKLKFASTKNFETASHPVATIDTEQLKVDIDNQLSNNKLFTSIDNLTEDSDFKLDDVQLYKLAGKSENVFDKFKAFLNLNEEEKINKVVINKLLDNDTQDLGRGLISPQKLPLDKLIKLLFISKKIFEKDNDNKVARMFLQKSYEGVKFHLGTQAKLKAGAFLINHITPENIDNTIIDVLQSKATPLVASIAKDLISGEYGILNIDLLKSPEKNRELNLLLNLVSRSGDSDKLLAKIAKSGKLTKNNFLLIVDKLFDIEKNNYHDNNIASFLENIEFKDKEKPLGGSDWVAIYKKAISHQKDQPVVKILEVIEEKIKDDKEMAVLSSDIQKFKATLEQKNKNLKNPLIDYANVVLHGINKDNTSNYYSLKDYTSEFELQKDIANNNTQQIDVVHGDDNILTKFIINELHESLNKKVSMLDDIIRDNAHETAIKLTKDTNLRNQIIFNAIQSEHTPTLDRKTIVTLAKLSNFHFNIEPSENTEEIDTHIDLDRINGHKLIEKMKDFHTNGVKFKLITNNDLLNKKLEDIIKQTTSPNSMNKAEVANELDEILSLPIDKISDKMLINKPTDNNTDTNLQHTDSDLARNHLTKARP